MSVLLTMIIFSAPFLYGSSEIAAKDYVVIVHDETFKGQFQELSREEIKQIYLGERVYWKDGSRIFPARLSDDSEALEKFIEDNMGMAVPKFISFWRRRLFSGRGIPPKTIDSQNEMLEFVQKRAGAIGFVSKDTVNEETFQGVKILP